MMPESSAPGGELHAWAERLADALRSDDGDAFIDAYDALLDDPARYDDEQVELIKDLARHISDRAGEAAASGQRSAQSPPTLARNIAHREVPSAAGDPRGPSNPPAVCGGASGHGERVASERASSAAAGVGHDVLPRPAACTIEDAVQPAARTVDGRAPAASAKLWRDVGVQADMDARPLPARDAVLLMLGRRWADACLSDQHASGASGSAAVAVVRKRTRRRRLQVQS